MLFIIFSIQLLPGKHTLCVVLVSSGEHNYFKQLHFGFVQYLLLRKDVQVMSYVFHLYVSVTYDIPPHFSSSLHLKDTEKWFPEERNTLNEVITRVQTATDEDSVYESIVNSNKHTGPIQIPSSGERQREVNFWEFLDQNWGNNTIFKDQVYGSKFSEG